MKTGTRLASLLCAGALVLHIALPIRATTYPDLPETHWAYQDMTRAVEKGILNGMGDGSMAPDGTLTWGQFLVMLSRTFAPDYYAAMLSEGERWDVAGLYTAIDGEVLPDDGFLTVTEDTLGQPINRQDVAVLLDRAIPEISNPANWSETGALTQATAALSDFAGMEHTYRSALARLYSLGVVKGKSDGTFGGQDILRRCDGTVLLMRALALPREVPAKPTPTPAPTSKPRPVTPTVPTTAPTVTPTVTPSPTATPVPTVAPTATPTPTAAPTTDYPWTDPALWEIDDNPTKRIMLYGSASKNSYSTKAEAQAEMEVVVVPVWQLSSSGEKVSKTINLQVNKALAADVLAIFTEIYNDPEQFPIRSAGCFSWRSNTKSEHRAGTAIDISATENYQVRDGNAMVGTHWTPGEDPYSIPEDGSVVRIFHAHGWTWGGADWAGHSDPNVGYHDYMHFSYLGG